MKKTSFIVKFDFPVISFVFKHRTILRLCTIERNSSPKYY
jgi:hypothetical protein